MEEKAKKWGFNFQIGFLQLIFSYTDSQLQISLIIMGLGILILHENYLMLYIIPFKYINRNLIDKVCAVGCVIAKMVYILLIRWLNGCSTLHIK